MTVEKDEVIELKPFVLDFDRRAGFLDFRPTIVSADPKEQSAAAPYVEPPPVETQPELPIDPLLVTQPKLPTEPPITTPAVDAEPMPLRIPASKSITPSAP